MIDGVDDVVDHEGIAASGDVVKSAAQGEIVAEKVKAFFQLQVEGEIFGETLGAGSADQLLLGVEEAEGKSGAGFDRVGELHLVDDGEVEEGHVSPGEKAVDRKSTCLN